MIFKRILAWGMYDLANTIYSALFVTFFFPLYIKNYLGGTEFMIGATFSLSMLLVGLCVPVLGAISDMVKRRMPFIIFFTILNCLAVIFVPHASLWPALALALAANFFYHAGLNVYNALLPFVAKGHGLGEVSGIGVAMGYLGTLISLAISYAVLNFFGLGELQGIKMVFYATAIMFFSFSLFTFFGVSEPRVSRIHLPFSRSLAHVFSNVKHGLKDIVSRSSLRSFLLASFCFTNAMNAVIIFLFLYGQKTFGLTIQSFFPVYALFALGAVAGSLLLAKSIDTHGGRAVLTLAAGIWIVVILLLSSLNIVSELIGVAPYTLFILSGILGGAALGLVWSSNRPLLIQLAPKRKLAEYFGFLELTDKFSGVLGPLVFGYLATYHGYSTALYSLLAFFAVGLWFLKKVQFKPLIKMA